MNANYINKKLIIWSELFYGKDAECFSKEKDDGFVFGSKKLKIENRVSKEVALFLASSQLLNFSLVKTRYQIVYYDLEIEANRYHSHGAVYDSEQVKKEIKILKREQKQLKKLGMSKTKTNFSTIEVQII